MALTAEEIIAVASQLTAVDRRRLMEALTAGSLVPPFIRPTRDPLASLLKLEIDSTHCRLPSARHESTSFQLEPFI
jgi:hypothetical protein